MLAPSLMALGVASLATCLSVNTKEEIVKVFMAFIALLSWLLTLVFSPWEIKLLVVVMPFVWQKFRTRLK